MKKVDLKELIARAKKIHGTLSEDDSSFALLDNCIKEAEDILSDIKGELTPHQEEVYQKLEIAVGP